MDRLISEQEVLKVIENAMIFADWRDNKYDAFHKLEEDIKAISPAEPKWIPVSERLPEDDGEYLATIYDTDENYKYMDIAEWEDGIWQYKDYIKVLAWMPLPTSYEPQERSK